MNATNIARLVWNEVKGNHLVEYRNIDYTEAHALLEYANKQNAEVTGKMNTGGTDRYNCVDKKTSMIGVLEELFAPVDRSTIGYPDQDFLGEYSMYQMKDGTKKHYLDLRTVLNGGPQALDAKQNYWANISFETKE